MSIMEAKAQAVLDLLAEEGPMTAEDICASFGWEKAEFTNVLRWAREEPLDETGTQRGQSFLDRKGNQIVPNMGGDWTYSLDPDWHLSRKWIMNRFADMTTRSHTMLGVARWTTRITDARTRLGRLARIFERHLTRLVEDLDVYAEEIKEAETLAGRAR